MTKKELIEQALNNVSDVNLGFKRVYGVPMGVGYDYTAFITLKGGKRITLDVHAGPRAWAMTGHLRSNQYVYNNYKGSDTYPERYVYQIEKYWQKGSGLNEYLSRFTKTDLIDAVNNMFNPEA